jgi:hypothetical protein
MFGGGGRFRAKQAPGMDIALPAAKVGGVRKRLGLGIEDERELSLRHAQNLVIPVRHGGDKVIIPFKEITGQGTLTERGDPRIGLVISDNGSNVRTPNTHWGSGFTSRGVRIIAQPGRAGLSAKSEVEVKYALCNREGSSGFPPVGVGEGVTLSTRCS